MKKMRGTEIALIVCVLFSSFVIFPILDFEARRRGVSLPLTGFVIQQMGFHPSRPLALLNIWVSDVLPFLFLSVWIMATLVAVVIKSEKFFLTYLYWIFVMYAVVFNYAWWAFRHLLPVDSEQLSRISWAMQDLFYTPAQGIGYMFAHLFGRFPLANATVHIFMCMNMLLLGAGLYVFTRWRKNQKRSHTNEH
ncbi:MAG: hypothetical protein FWC70_03705 [Defluviitaleaceae bacterium]|nr:hypothetical protein [Defluviitaleaceae bacterium]